MDSDDIGHQVVCSGTVNGVFGFVYCGILGIGMGVFKVVNSSLTGSDCAGGKYTGSVELNAHTNEVTISFELAVPAGTPLVMGASAQDIKYIKSGEVKIPSGFEDGIPFNVYVPPGNITMMVKRVPEEWGSMVNGFTLALLPPPAPLTKI